MSQNFGGLPQKVGGQKHAKMLVDFGQLQNSIAIANISGTDGDIQNRKDVIDSDFSRVRRKKSGDLWSTNNKVVHVSLDTPKSTFSEDHISAPRLKFLHALMNDKVC